MTGFAPPELSKAWIEFFRDEARELLEMLAAYVDQFSVEQFRTGSTPTSKFNVVRHREVYQKYDNWYMKGRDVVRIYSPDHMEQFASLGSHFQHILRQPFDPSDPEPRHIVDRMVSIVSLHPIPTIFSLDSSLVRKVSEFFRINRAKAIVSIIAAAATVAVAMWKLVFGGPIPK